MARGPDLLRRIAALHQQARQAGWAYRFEHGRSLLATALRLLDDDRAASPEGAALRVGVLVSLAYAESESGSAAAGLRRLADTAPYLAAVPADRALELEGLVLANRALLLHRGGRLDEALDLFGRTITVLERNLADGGDAATLVAAYLNRATSYIGLGEVTAAARDLRRCIQVAERHGEQTVAAKARHNLGYVAYMVGDMPTALRHYAETERSYRTLAASMLPTLRLDQARASLAAGLSEDAARYLDDALPRLRSQRVGQDVAETELTRAAAALLDGHLSSARRWARSAQRRFTARGNTRWAGIAALTGLRVDTAAALAASRVPAALPERASALAETLRAQGLPDETALALLLGTRLHLRRGDAAAARALLDQVRGPRPAAPVDHRMLFRLCRAELAVADGDLRRALAEARSGLTELGRARDRMGGLELVCGTAIHGQALGELAVRLVLDRRHTDARQVFGWLERTRAQVYRYEPLPEIDDPLFAAKVADIRRLRRAAQLERLAGRPGRKQLAQATALERDVLRQGWYATQWGRPRPVATLGEVGAALGERALVTFAVSGSDLVAVVVAAHRCHLVRLGSADNAAEWATRLHADLDVLAPDHLPAPIVAVVTASALRSAEALDAQLVAPLLPLLGDRELVVVPTGALYAVPWGTLPSLRGRPVVVAPSATAWLSAVVTEPGTGDRVVLATGPLLTGLVGEDDALAATYPGAVALAGERATAEAVLTALDGADVAHLAAHGAHEPGNALFSRLELADGPLYAHELSRLGRPPRHVVLAACELALNHVRPGDEALGFAGALLAGGVRTVVAAASRVGDTAAATAMADYHRRLAEGTAPAAALAESIARDPFRRPFVCLGAS